MDLIKLATSASGKKETIKVKILDSSDPEIAGKIIPLGKTLPSTSSRKAIPSAPKDNQPPAGNPDDQSPSGQHPHEPEIKLIQCEDGSSDLIFTCTCGQETVIHCTPLEKETPPPPPETQPAP